MCGMQWTTTDFMGLEPKELLFEYNGCTEYQEVLVKGNIKDNLENYMDNLDIFPNTLKYYGENTTTFAAELSIVQPFYNSVAGIILFISYCLPLQGWESQEASLYHC